MNYREVFIEEHGKGPHDCFFCELPVKYFDVHHINGDHSYSDVQNLAAVHLYCHAKESAVTVSSDQFKIIGQQLNMVERARISAAGQLRNVKRQFDDDLTGHLLEEQLIQLSSLESEIEKELIRLYKEDPLYQWTKPIRGAGDKIVARLLASAGRPSDRTSAGQWRQYLGWGAPERRRKGMSAEDVKAFGNPVAKTRAWLIADQFIRLSNPTYRPVYDAAKLKYECNEDWPQVRKHKAAMRVMLKQFLTDMWKEDRRLLASGEHQCQPEAA